MDELNDFAERYAAAWCGREPRAVAEFYEEDGWLSVNGGEPARGREAVTEVARGFMTAFPDMVVAFDGLVRADEGTEFHWTLTGTNTGPGGTGRAVRISGHELWRIGGSGLIATSRGRFDEADYQRQLAGDDTG